MHLKLVVSNLSSLSSTNSDVLCLQYLVLNVIAELHEFMTYFQIDSGFLQLSLQMYFFLESGFYYPLSVFSGGIAFFIALLSAFRFTQ